VKTIHVQTNDQTTDMFTMPLGLKQLTALIGKLGVLNIHANLRGSIKERNQS
jgi:hypothetical protein